MNICKLTTWSFLQKPQQVFSLLIGLKFHWNVAKCGLVACVYICICVIEIQYNRSRFCTKLLGSKNVGKIQMQIQILLIYEIFYLLLELYKLCEVPWCNPSPLEEIFLTLVFSIEKSKYLEKFSFKVKFIKRLFETTLPYSHC